MAGFDHDVIVVDSRIGGGRRTADNVFADYQGKPLDFGVEGSATA